MTSRIVAWIAVGVILSTLGVLGASCRSTDYDIGPPLLQQAVSALGGFEAVRAATNEKVEATSRRFERGQAVSAIDDTVLVADYTFVRTLEFEADRLRIDLVKTNPFFALPESLAYREIIDGSTGYVDGKDSIVPCVPNSGCSASNDRHWLLSSRITAQLKHSEMTSPLRILHNALTRRAAVHEVVGDGANKALQIDDVHLTVDTVTSLPTKAEVLEHHPPFGDRRVEVFYEDYRDVAAVRLPFRVTMKVDGVVILEETRAAIATNVPTPKDFYAVPPELQQRFDEGDGRRGKRTAQWFLAYEALGLPEDYMSQAKLKSTFIQLEPGIVWIKGPIRHHNLLIEMKDHLVLVDAPISEERSETVLSEVHERFSGKPIRKVVLTHFHHDHTAGIRRYAALGGITVFAGAPSVPFYRQTFTSPHTVSPDVLAARPAPVSVEGVERLLTLTDGHRVIELHRVASTHSNDALLVYLPAEKILYTTDIFSPGFPRGNPNLPGLTQLAGELVDELSRLKLQVNTIVGGHGLRPGTMGELREYAGRE